MLPTFFECVTISDIPRSTIEWLAFGVLSMRFYLRFWPYLLIVLEDLGLKSFESLPIASRVILGLFQGIAVRASGLTIISIGSLAPALQYVLFFLCNANSENHIFQIPLRRADVHWR